MFEETPASSLMEANYRAAMDFLMQRMNPGTKRSKKWLSFFQSVACAKAGFEVQQGLGYSDAGVTTGMRCTKETKWSDHFDAFSRHVNLLFTDTLSPYKKDLPSWLTAQFIMQRTLNGAPFDRTKMTLWKSFELINRVVRNTYLPYYNKLVPDKLPSGKAWLEFFEKFRRTLFFADRKAGPTKDTAEEDTAAEVDTNTQVPEEEAAHDDDTDDDATGRDLPVVDTADPDNLVVPEDYLSSYLLAFLELGPCSLEPNAAWNINSLEVAKSKKVVQLPSSTPLERTSTTYQQDPITISPDNFLTPSPITGLSRKSISDLKNEFLANKGHKRKRDDGAALELAALERNNTLLEQKNVILANKEVSHAKFACMQMKKEAIKMAEELDMDPDAIKQLKLEYFDLCKGGC